MISILPSSYLTAYLPPSIHHKVYTLSLSLLNAHMPWTQVPYIWHSAHRLFYSMVHGIEMVVRNVQLILKQISEVSTSVVVIHVWAGKAYTLGGQCHPFPGQFPLKWYRSSFDLKQVSCCSPFRTSFIPDPYRSQQQKQ